MTKGRVEAFTDGVIAILITILVLEFEIPHEATFAALNPLVPKILSYLMSFVFVGIYWNNHHHLMHLVRHIDGGCLWANMHLLFWLSLVPAATAWMGDTHFGAIPVATYGFVLLMSAVAFTILVRRLTSRGANNAALQAAIGRDRKGWLSLACYAAAIPLAFVSRWIALGLYVAVAITWFIPDTRMERAVVHEAAD